MRARESKENIKPQATADECLQELEAMESPLITTFDPGMTGWVAPGFDAGAIDSTPTKKTASWKSFWKHVFAVTAVVSAVTLTAGIIDLDPTGNEGVRAIIDDAVATAGKTGQKWIALVVDGGEYFRIAHQLWGAPLEKRVLLLWGGFHFLM